MNHVLRILLQSYHPPGQRYIHHVQRRDLHLVVTAPASRSQCASPRRPPSAASSSIPR